MDRECILKLISENKIRTAIEKLLNEVQLTSDSRDSLLLLKSRLCFVQEQENCGVLAFAESITQRSLIMKSALEIVHTIDFNSLQKQESPKSKFTLTLEGNFDQDDEKRINLILKKLMALTNDYSLKIHKVTSGSIKIELEGKEDSFKLLLELFLKTPTLLSDFLEHKVLNLEANDECPYLQFPKEDSLDKFIPLKEHKKILFITPDTLSLSGKKGAIDQEYRRLSKSLHSFGEDYELVTWGVKSVQDLLTGIVNHEPMILHISGYGDETIIEAITRNSSAKNLAFGKTKYVFLDSNCSLAQAKSISETGTCVVIKGTMRKEFEARLMYRFYKTIHDEIDVRSCFQKDFEELTTVWENGIQIK